MSIIRIETKTTGIPVELGKLKFSFDTSDENIKNFITAGEEMVKRVDAIQVDDDDSLKAMKQTESALREGFDLVLGEGAFEQIYEQTPSLFLLLEYFEALTNGINAELKKMGLDASKRSRDKYVKRK